MSTLGCMGHWISSHSDRAFDSRGPFNLPRRRLVPGRGFYLVHTLRLLLLEACILMAGDNKLLIVAVVTRCARFSKVIVSDHTRHSYSQSPGAYMFSENKKLTAQVEVISVVQYRNLLSKQKHMSTLFNSPQCTIGQSKHPSASAASAHCGWSPAWTALWITRSNVASDIITSELILALPKPRIDVRVEEIPLSRGPAVLLAVIPHLLYAPRNLLAS